MQRYYLFTCLYIIQGNSYTSLRNDELKTKLSEALSDESYEKAAKIRDELNKRRSS
jgi:protein-arginine kinase activator protein McsA